MNIGRILSNKEYIAMLVGCVHCHVIKSKIKKHSVDEDKKL